MADASPKDDQTCARWKKMPPAVKVLCEGEREMNLINPRRLGNS